MALGVGVGGWDGGGWMGVGVGGWGGGGWIWVGVDGGLGVAPTHMHMHAHAGTHTHTCMHGKHDNFMQMAASIGFLGNAWEFPMMSYVCAHPCACVHVCTCGHV